MKSKALSHFIIRPLFRVGFIVIFFSSLSLSLLSSNIYAQRWTQHSSEAEVYEQIYQLLIKAELPPQKIKRGSYPLYLSEQDRSSFPLLSTPCPILSDCESLLKSIRNTILRSGYHLVYPETSPRANGPLHYAIAKGKKAVMALRLIPKTSIATLLYHLSSVNELMRSDIQSLPEHLTLSISDNDLLQHPELITWLDMEGREYVITLDPLNIKRALIHPSTGQLYTNASERATALQTLLLKLIQQAPNSVGFYINQELNLTFDRVMLDQLMLSCEKHNRILALSKLSDTLIHSLALAYGVRSFNFTEQVNGKSIKTELKSLEAQLVIEGEIHSEFEVNSIESKASFIRWLNHLSSRDVMILRLSESAW